MSSWKIKTPNVAVVVLTVFAFSHGVLNTYFPSMVTNLEKRFELQTSQMGWLLGANDIGYLTTVLPVAFFARKYSQSKILGFSGIVLAASGYLWTLPYFIFGPKFTAAEIRDAATDDVIIDGIRHDKTICRLNQSIAANFSVTEYFSPVNIGTQRGVTIGIQMVAGILNGIGSSPMWTIGLTMLDDIKRGKSGPFIGIVSVFRALSPICGYFFGSWVSRNHETFQMTSSQVPGGQKNPMWTAGWWIGGIIFSTLVLIVTPFMLCFDDSMLSEQDDAESTEKLPEDQTAMESAKEFLHVFRDLMTNKVFIFLLSGMIFEVFAFVGIYTFFPKYLESYFNIEASKANMYTGVTLAGSYVFSMFISGIVAKIFPMQMISMNLYHFAVNLASGLLFFILFAFVCDTPTMLGVPTSTSANALGCSTGCNCPITVYKPVCDGVNSYYSACMAGCSSSSIGNIYANCSCAPSKELTTGACGNACPGLVWYLVLFFVIKVIGGIAGVQFLLILLGLLKNRRYKPITMAGMGFLFGILGILLPPLNGKIIDSVCLVKNPGGRGRSFCLFYDTERFRWLLHGICIGVQMPGYVLYGGAWWYARKQYPNRSTATYRDGKTAAPSDAAEIPLTA